MPTTSVVPPRTYSAPSAMIREATTMSATAELCTVCSEPVEPHTDSLCGACGQTFHLNQRTDLPGKDCGDVWINPDHLGLEFTCASCLAEPADDDAPANTLDSVLDLPEAAAVLGVPEDDLSERARRGEVPHRKTAGGLLLFERDTIKTLQEGNPK